MTFKVIRPCLFCDEPGSSRDHLLPAMFGPFENNLTNFNVCSGCNNTHFGHKLETRFGRNSFEAILRLIFGAKSPDKAHEIGGNRVTISYLENDEFRGARLRLVSDGVGGIQAEMPPQVLIRHATLDVPLALLEEEITPEAVKPFLRGSEIWIPGDLGDQTLRLRAKLQHAGLEFVGEMECVPVSRGPAREFLLRIEGIVDDDIARVIAKIAVNFLAVSVGYEFAMRPEFQPIRKYARYGDPNLRHRIHPHVRSIELDGSRARYGHGHLMTIDWSPVTSEVIVLVSLFNRITYQVDLADDVKTVWRNIRTAYYFDIANRQVKRLEVDPGEHMSLIAKTGR